MSVIKQSKRERLEAKGWKARAASVFLESTPEETILVEIKLALSQGLKERRQELTPQSALSSKISSSSLELPGLKTVMRQFRLT
ncbi:MAG: hypothetical protein ACFB2W_12825 [Leptolyngbyaceae cyanobacterium]